MEIQRLDSRESQVAVEFDFGLGEDVELLRNQVSRFAAEHIAPRADEIDRTNIFPTDLWRELGNLGLLGLTVDVEYGGSGFGYLEHTIAMEEISRASGSVGLSYGAHSNLCVNQIRLNGTSEQKKEYLPKLISGEYVGALAMSEAEAGSDVLSMRSTLEKQGDDYVLNGSKMWITNGPTADVIVVYARLQDPATTAESERGRPRISAVIVEKGMQGFSADPKMDKLGMRGSDTSGLSFDRCHIPQENVLPGDGATILMSGLDFERVVLAGGPLGIMRACVDLVLPYVHFRKQFSQSIGKFELMQGKIADMYSTMNSCRAYVYAVARACDQGLVTRFDAAAAILNASEKATWVASEAIQALGGNGYINEYPAGRFLRDAKLYEIGAGTNEIRRMLIGRELFEATV